MVKCNDDASALADHEDLFSLVSRNLVILEFNTLTCDRHNVSVQANAGNSPSCLDSTYILAAHAARFVAANTTVVEATL